MPSRLLYLSLFTFLLQACTTTPDKPPNSNTNDLFPQLSLADYFMKKYEGTIGDDLPIVLTLINWGDGNLSGWYTSKKDKKRIVLDGLVNLDESIVVDGYKEDQENGRFKASALDLRQIRGQWRNADSTTVTDFELIETPIVDEKGWTGTWHLNEVWDSGLLILGNVDEKAGTLDFGLDIFRNAHAGIIEGTALIKGNKATFKARYDGEEGCELVFVLKEDYIELEQNSSPWACGFGMRAYAGGKYESNKRTVKPDISYGNEEDAAFLNKAQHDAFKALTGDNYYETFAFNMQYYERTALEEPIDSANSFLLKGWVYGMMSSNKTLILFDESNLFWAATTDVEEGNDVIRFFTNTEEEEDNWPEAIKDWKKEKRNYQFIIQKKEE